MLPSKPKDIVGPLGVEFTVVLADAVLPSEKFTLRVKFDPGTNICPK
jgi:hypothetical protein